MDANTTSTFFSPFHTFLYGFGLGAVFLLLSLYNHWKTKREFRRYKLHLSDKLELDAKQLTESNKERARLSQENEHLRLQNARLTERSDNKLERELEILARAEKHMLINAPGFAPAWEMAKSNAMAQIQSEDKGQSLPQKIFRKLMGTGGQGTVVALPAESASSAPKPESDKPGAA